MTSSETETPKTRTTLSLSNHHRHSQRIESRSKPENLELQISQYHLLQPRSMAKPQLEQSISHTEGRRIQKIQQRVTNLLISVLRDPTKNRTAELQQKPTIQAHKFTFAELDRVFKSAQNVAAAQTIHRIAVALKLRWSFAFRETWLTDVACFGHMGTRPLS